MKLYEPEGFIYNADIYCVDCFKKHFKEGEEEGIIFPDAEVDSPMHCIECEEVIPTDLTNEGINYVIEKIIDFFADSRGRPKTLIQWLNTWQEEIEGEIISFIYDSLNNAAKRDDVNDR